MRKIIKNMHDEVELIEIMCIQLASEIADIQTGTFCVGGSNANVFVRSIDLSYLEQVFACATNSHKPVPAPLRGSSR